MNSIRLLIVTLCLCAGSALAAPATIIPNAAPHGARVLIAGSAAAAPDLAVAFTDTDGNAVATPVVASTANYAEVIVPASAASGAVRVTSGGNTVALSFTVLADPPFAFVHTVAASDRSNDVFKAPNGIAIAPDGTLFVADTAHEVISVITPGHAPAVLAGSWNRSGFADGSGTSALFKEPMGIAYDATTDTLCVADASNNAIRRMTRAGVVTTIATADFKAPRALAVDRSGNVIVADTANSMIRRISAGGAITTIAGSTRIGFADGAAAQALFASPSGVAIDRDGAVYVADTDNNRVRKIANGLVTTVAGNAQQGWLDGGAALAQFKKPFGIAVDDGGSIYVADSGNNVLRVISGGSVSTIAGNGALAFADGTPSAASFKVPAGIAFASAIFVADSGNDAIRLLAPALHLSALYPGRGPEAGGNTTRLLGWGFIPGLTSVTVNGAAVAAAFIASTEITVTMPPGSGDATVSVTTPAGTAQLTYTYLPPPTITVVAPLKGRSAGGDTVTISGTNFGTAEDTTVTFGSAAATITASTATTITATTPAGTAGAVDVTVNAPGGTATRISAFTYVDPPAITSVTPSRGRTAGGETISIAGTNFDDGTTTVTIGGTTATNVLVVSPTLVNVTTPPGTAGPATITVTTAGGTASRAAAFTYVPPPVISAFTPPSGSVGATVTIGGQNFDPIAANDAVTIGGAAAAVSNATTTQLVVAVPANAVTGRITVTTAGGVAISATDFVVATFRSLAVTAPTTSLQPGTQQQFNAIATLLDNSTRDVTSSATWSSANPGVATVSATGVVTAVTTGSADITATFSGLTGIAHVTVQTVITLPPVAMQGPPVDRTIVVPIADTLRFLYSGPNAIQTGVAANTIDDDRVATTSGRVIDRDGNPLFGVQVTIGKHAEFGQTLTRADGRYDIAFNGGGALHLSFSKSGYINADRLFTTTWNQQKVLDDVALVQYDTAVTEVTMNAPTSQIARGNPVTDSDGTRRATILFPAGITATLKNADGTTAPATTLHVRATEFTVGSNGPKAMPAALPPTSAYTYCVELSVDEAPGVTFSAKVPVYVDNFLNFPVGTGVPIGYFERAKQQWIPSANGAVMKVLSVSAGVAAIDSTGSGQADSQARLTLLGIDAAELSNIGTLYSAGQTLWRFRTDHFTPMDANLADIYGFAQLEPDYPPDASVSVSNCARCPGSIVEVENQRLGESVGVTGTPFTLNYTSGAADQRHYTVVAHASRNTFRNTPQSIAVTFSVAGRSVTQEFTPRPNLDVTFTWDGLDAYGRAVEGTRTADVTVTYKYAASYTAPAGDPAFGQMSATGAVVGPARVGIVWSSARSISLGHVSNAATGFGGWTFSAQRAYDSIGRTLYEPGQPEKGGDLARTGEATLYRSAGNGIFASGIAAGGSAAQTSINTVTSIAPTADGSYYFVDTFLRAVYRVSRAGTMTLVAGGGQTPANDGSNAVGTSISPFTVAVGPDDVIYFDDIVPNTANRRIRRVVNGKLETVAGGGAGGDGGAATAARLGAVLGLAVGGDNVLYISDSGCSCIHRVGPDALMTRIAGGGSSFAGDIPALRAAVFPRGLAIGPDGSLYFSNTDQISRITPDGYLHYVAGAVSNGSTPQDGAIATSVHFGQVYGVSVAGDGTVIFADRSANRVWSVSGNVIHLLAGTEPDFNSGSVPQDGILARAAKLYFIYDVKVGPDGTLYIADSEHAAIFRSSSTFPPLNRASSTIIPAADGVIGYVFESGRHVRTINTVTGTTLQTLTYDANGFITSVTDLDGNATHIERSGDGTPSAIVAPGGQRTTLAIDSTGRLTGVTDPKNESTTFEYNGIGLLAQLTDSRHGIHKFTYDASGALVKDEDPAGGFLTLTRTGTNTNFSVVRSSAEGRLAAAGWQQASFSTTTRATTGADGLVTTTTENGDGSTSVTSPSGSVQTSVLTPDSRFGMSSPVTATATVQTPSGLKATLTASRQVTLSNPADPLSLVSLTETLAINGRTSHSTFTRASRRLTTTSITGRTHSVIYDEKDHPVTRQLPGLAAVQFTYESHGLVSAVAAGARQTSVTYDDHLRMKTVTDPLHRTVSFDYDDADRVTLQTLPGGRQIAFTYDAAGNVTSITPPSRPVHAFTFTPVDLLDSYTPPSVANVTATKTTYNWNRDKQLTGVTRPDGAIFAFAYDSAGRLSTLTEPLGTHRYTYDGAKGTLASIAAPDGNSVAFTYDGDLPTAVVSTGAVSASVGFSYDSSFRVTGETVNGTSTIAFGYDDDDLLIAAGALTLHRDAANGLLTGTTLGNITDSYTYNTFGEPNAYNVQLNGANIFTLGYTRDDAGRIAARTETVNGTTTLTSYTYDDAGRLSDVNTAGAITHYSYDDNGNRTSVDSPSGSIVATYDAQDRLVTYNGASYFYSDNGELQKKIDATGTTTYTYDVLGNLRHVTLPDGTLIDYVIDAMNRRVGKKINGTLTTGWIYSDALHIVAETDGAGAVTKRFVYGLRANTPEYMIYNGVTYRLISDGRGSIRYVVGATTGTLVEALDYDSWGNVLSDTSPGLQPFGFGAGVYDRHTHFTRFGTRDYDGITGRWTVKDPIGFNGGQTNVYSLTRDDPLNYSDPTGTLTIPFLGWVDMGENAGSIALTSYADTLADANASLLQRAAAGIGGFFSALWTPCTSDATAATLLSGEGLGRWSARPFWQYYPEGNPAYSSRWLTRGLGWSSPYETGADAQSALALPPWNDGTAVRPYTPGTFEYVSGPRIVVPDYMEPGGGVEYYRGSSFPH
jgi:RHS repeat-associated protein